MSSEFNVCDFIPEHDLTKFFAKTELDPKRIYNFWNYFDTVSAKHSECLETLSHMQNTKFKSYGVCNADGWLPYGELPLQMRAAGFAWHIKPGCCGFVARQLLSSGTPLIISRKSLNHFHTLARDFLVDGVNCLNIDDKTPKQIAEEIKAASEPERYARMVAKAASVHSEEGFDEQAKKIKQYLSSINGKNFI